MTRTLIHKLVDNERSRQDCNWGGQAHDDNHTDREWILFVQKQLTRAESAENSNEYIAAMVKVAASAVAAIESQARRHNLLDSQENEMPVH